MGNFLRDEYIRNITLDEDSLQAISEYFEDKAKQLEIEKQEHQNGNQITVVYIIRFDNKGYRFTSFADVKKCYLHAKEIERVNFTLETTESYLSNRVNGEYIELRLDSRDMNNCNLVCSSNDQNWVDSVICGILEILNKQTNSHHLVRNAWMQFLIQIAGITFGFFLSLWAGKVISPYLNI